MRREEGDFVPQEEKDSKSPSMEEQNKEVLEQKEDLEKMRKKIAELEDRWLRAIAELENFKKRWMKEKQEIVKFALVDLMINILPLLDHFDKAMENLPSEKGNFEKGIELIFKEMYNILSSYGLEKIDDITGKEFDPFEHEAIDYEESKEIPEGKIIKVLRAGYKFKDRLLRPALVKVSKGAIKKEEKEPGVKEKDAGEEITN